MIAKLNAIFFLGNMGTGKSYWIDQAGFSRRGFWIYDVDRYLFHLARKEQVPSFHETIYEQNDANFERFFKAVSIAQYFLKNQIGQCNSIIIESTGNNLPYLLELESFLLTKPYTVHYFILHNSLAKKLENNQTRKLEGKNTPPDEVIANKESIHHENMEFIRKSRSNVLDFDLTQCPFTPLCRSEAVSAFLKPLAVEKSADQRKIIDDHEQAKKMADLRIWHEMRSYQIPRGRELAP